MKLVEMEIEGFRCYRDRFVISFEDITTIIGKNDIGKSSVLEAIDAFFNDQIDSEDYSVGGNAVVRIACTFKNLPRNITLDENVKTTLESECLTISDDRLKIVKYYSGAKPKSKSIRIEARHPSKDKYDDLLSLKIEQLKKRAKDLGVDIESVNKTVKKEIRDAIRSSCSDLELKISEIEIKDEDSGVIYSKIKDALPVFALFKSDRQSSDQDAEAQDPMRIAVKEAIANEVEELERIKSVVKGKVEEVARLTVEKLGEMNPTLAAGLRPKVDTKAWDSVFSIKLEDEGEVPLNKRGSGVRRLVLLNFFRAKEEQAAADGGRGLILAVEEPETSQHPDHQRMLLDAFRGLADSGTQIIFTTHTPALARRVDQRSIRYVDCDEAGCRLVSEHGDDVLMRVSKALGVLPDTSVKLFIGVEGPRDEDFWRGMSAVLRQDDPSIPDLDTLAAEGEVLFIPLGGSTIDKWVGKLKNLNIPEIHICDRDNTPGLPGKYQDIVDAFNAVDGCCAFMTDFRETENYLHPDAICEEYVGIMLPAIDGGSDVPKIVARCVHEAGGGKPWDELDAERVGKKESAAKRRLNKDVVARMTLERLDAVDPGGFVHSVFARISSYLNV